MIQRKPTIFLRELYWLGQEQYRNITKWRVFCSYNIWHQEIDWEGCSFPYKLRFVSYKKGEWLLCTQVFRLRGSAYKEPHRSLSLTWTLNLLPGWLGMVLTYSAQGQNVNNLWPESRLLYPFSRKTAMNFFDSLPFRNGVYGAFKSGMDFACFNHECSRKDAFDFWS